MDSAVAIDWASLESPLDEEPLFPVEDPDGNKTWGEIDRAVDFRRLVHLAAPRIVLFANANAGKRNPVQARREGILAGVFDYTAAWDYPAHAYDRCVAWAEFKGYDARGRPGRLSPAQIEFGNRLHKMGHKVACFFRPESALQWLKACGAPVTGRVTA